MGLEIIRSENFTIKLLNGNSKSLTYYQAMGWDGTERNLSPVYITIGTNSIQVFGNYEVSHESVT